MVFWLDKYRPKTLDQLDIHTEVNQHLSSLAASKDIPHLLFVGPSGAGKKTRIRALLAHLYGSAAVERIRMDTRPFETPSGRKLEMQILSSNYHLEINPSEVGIYDRVVVQDIIKFLQVMQKHGYIEEFEIIDDHRAGKIVISLNGRLNKAAVISPRYDVKITDLEKLATNLLPSRQFGQIVLTTSMGIMDHNEARRRHTGGKVLGYFY